MDGPHDSHIVPSEINEEEGQESCAEERDDGNPDVPVSTYRSRRRVLARRHISVGSEQNDPSRQHDECRNQGSWTDFQELFGELYKIPRNSEYDL